jgi:hypothetical protein
MLKVPGIFGICGLLELWLSFSPRCSYTTSSFTSGVARRQAQFAFLRGSSHDNPDLFSNLRGRSRPVYMRRGRALPFRHHSGRNRGPGLSLLEMMAETKGSGEWLVASPLGDPPALPRRQ